RMISTIELRVSTADLAGLRVALGEDLLDHELQLLERARAMRDAVLLVVPELRHRLVGALDEEERVVAEAAGASRRARDLPLAAPLDDIRLTVADERIDQREHAPEARGVRGAAAGARARGIDLERV